MTIRATTTITLTNPTVGDLREMLAKVPTEADGKTVNVTSYQDRPFDPIEKTISVTFEA